MNDEPRFPLGAESADDVLAARAAGRLEPDERAAVDAWLADHPEWNGRAEALDAIARAIRHDAAAVKAPELDSLAGPWSVPVAPRVAIVPLRRDWATGWMAGLAAAALVAVVAAAIVVGGGGGGSDDAGSGDGDATISSGGIEAPERTDAPGAAPPGTATGGNTSGGTTPGAAPGTAPASAAPDTTASAAATTGAAGTTPSSEVGLPDAVAATRNQGTVRFRVAGTLTDEITGTGRVVFADRSLIEIETVGGPPASASAVRIGRRVWISCNGGPLVEDGESCESLDVDAPAFDVLGLLEAASRAEVDRPPATIERADGTVLIAYQFATATANVTIGVGADGLVREIVVEIAGEGNVIYTLDRFGEPAPIPVPD